jgi:ketopantoate reductase
MKICIFGAGAIGGYMGAKLAQAGADVSLVARGPHLAAMREKGLTLIEEGETFTVPVRASDDPAETRASGLCHRHAEGAFGAAGRCKDAAPDRR